jgi:hypothetical protein
MTFIPEHQSIVMYQSGTDNEHVSDLLDDLYALYSNYNSNKNLKESKRKQKNYQTNKTGMQQKSLFVQLGHWKGFRLAGTLP